MQHETQLPPFTAMMAKTGRCNDEDCADFRELLNKGSIMRELAFAITVAVITSVIQAVLTELWSHMARATQVACS
jgi:hypothetical protein